MKVSLNKKIRLSLSVLKKSLYKINQKLMGNLKRFINFLTLKLSYSNRKNPNKKQSPVFSKPLLQNKSKMKASLFTRQMSYFIWRHLQVESLPNRWAIVSLNRANKQNLWTRTEPPALNDACCPFLN